MKIMKPAPPATISRREVLKTITTAAVAIGSGLAFPTVAAATQTKPSLHVYPDYGKLRGGLEFLTEQPKVRAPWEIG